ncbi:hypothetical protein Y1Q_0022926 [Alligator mississippiensis]|uniref:Uncharacterized protein n=1 Tax=Alligator mississippiensis TaxID=8496 RepID=A0A151MHU8_ALLMI|nr:hypothetical protein Y1Q_0022926 [Alligator mississippiensis]
MDSLVSLIRCLISSQTCPGIHEEIQNHSQNAATAMRTAKEDMEVQLNNAHSQAVELTEKHEQMESEKMENLSSNDQLNLWMIFYQDSEKAAKKMGDTAQEHLDELMKQQKKVAKDEKWHSIARNIALVFLPFSNLMAGIIAAIFQTSLYIAQSAALELQGAIQHQKAKVFEYKEKCDLYDKKKKETQKKMEENKRKIEWIEEEIKKLSGKQENFGDQINDLRNHVQLLGDLLKKVEELELELSDEPDYAEALEVLKKIVTLWQKEKGQKLLNLLGDRVKKNLKDLKDAIQKLDTNDTVNTDV